MFDLFVIFAVFVQEALLGLRGNWKLAFSSSGVQRNFHMEGNFKYVYV